MSILIFIIILVALIIAHEFGHFVAAKATGMRVDEFGLGFPPRAAAWNPKKSETTYSLNWIPFGGFVKIFGEDAREAQGAKDSARSFGEKSKLAQAVVMVAGVAFNILFAWVLISIGFMSGLPTPVGTAPSGAVVENARLVLTSVGEGSPAADAGLMAGDVVVALVTNEAALQNGITPELISSFVSEHGGEQIAVLYKHGEENNTAFVTPEDGILENRPAIGVTMDMIGTLKLSFFQAWWEGAKTTAYLTSATAQGFWHLIVGAFTGAGGGLSDVTGPVGIVGLVGTAAEFGFVYLLGFTAFISINLAIINLIPFPALDGGRLFFLLIETVKRSPIKPAIASAANTIGFVLLLILMAVVTYNDIVKIVTG